MATLVEECIGTQAMHIRTVAAGRIWGRALAALAPLAEVFGACVLHPSIVTVTCGGIDKLAIHVVTRFLWE